MENLVQKMYNEVSEASKNEERNLQNVDVDFVANARVALNNGTCRITFKKANGDIVETIATTRDNVIKYGLKHTRERSQAVTPFFDLKEMRWRSFRWDRLLSCEIIK